MRGVSVCILMRVCLLWMLEWVVVHNVFGQHLRSYQSVVNYN